MARRTVLLITAVLIAALGTALVALYVQGVEQRALDKQKPVRVLVAKKVISAGTSAAAAAQAGEIQLSSVARDAVAPGALHDVTNIGAEVALAPIYPGEQILAQKFGKAGDATALSIPDAGTVAVSVALGQSARVNGYAVPGSRVDVFVTSAGSTRLLLTNVKVIAVGTHTLVPASGQNEGSVPSDVVTFGLTPPDAEKLIAAQSGGSVYLALLNNATTGGQSASASGAQESAAVSPAA